VRRNKLELYVHVVWSTWDRMPLISPEIERAAFRLMESEARKMGCTVMALNGMPEHVHMVVSLPTTVTVADIVKQVKGVSSRFVNQTVQPNGQFFKWQANYGAFTVSRWDLDKVIGYVKRQKEHHASNDLIQDWETATEDISPDGE